MSMITFSGCTLLFCAGWVLVIVFNLTWIGFTLDYEEEKKKSEGAPITGDVENAAATRK